MVARISDVKYDHNCVIVNLHEDAVKQIGTNLIIIEEDKGYLRIRPALTFDNNPRKIGPKGKYGKFHIMNYTADNAKEFIGEYKIEQEGDYFYLEKLGS